MPALALAEAFKIKKPDGKVLFIGTKKGIESRIVPEKGYDLALVRGGQVSQVGFSSSIKNIFALIAGVFDAVKILKRFAPMLVVSVGGYASVPAVTAAFLRGIPRFLLEQNAIPGRANRLLSRLAKEIYVMFPEAQKRLPSKKTFILGNPVRPSLLAAFQKASCTMTSAFPHLLVIGGSQGARTLNESMPVAAEMLLHDFPHLSVTHLAGQNETANVEERYKSYNISAHVIPFTDDMGTELADADLVIARAGATTCAELTACGKPSILVPYPYAVDDHQHFNAKYLVDSGAALLLEDSSCNGTFLSRAIKTILNDQGKLKAMSEAGKKIGRPDAGEKIIERLMQMTEETI